mmetsp:Transcript_113354/g.315571  ORF Transcript_113354/g.315571 Transcript_113354/m.315571 type:complete len:181 (+) Transcript_113354:129-671(+)
MSCSSEALRAEENSDAEILPREPLHSEGRATAPPGKVRLLFFLGVAGIVGLGGAAWKQKPWQAGARMERTSLAHVLQANEGNGAAKNETFYLKGAHYVQHYTDHVGEPANLRSLQTCTNSNGIQCSASEDHCCAFGYGCGGGSPKSCWRGGGCHAPCETCCCEPQGCGPGEGGCSGCSFY